jgi:hypothetical protein
MLITPIVIIVIFYKKVPDTIGFAVKIMYIRFCAENIQLKKVLDTVH